MFFYNHNLWPSFPHPQPLFEAFENDVMARYTPSLITGPKKLLVRFIYRGISTAVITAVGASVPYFSLFGGLIGSVSYWPLQVRCGMPGHHCIQDIPNRKLSSPPPS